MLFSDVKDEFLLVEKILEKFKQWKCDFYDLYISSYVPLYLPKLLSFYIKLSFANFDFLKVYFFKLFNLLFRILYLMIYLKKF